jgi:hypothetical protein
VKYFYDTEFHENGHTIDLISIGIVAEDGREYYAVNKSALWDRIAQHEWLMKNVVPQLPERGSPEWKFHDEIRDEVSAFLLEGVDTVKNWDSDYPVRYINTPELWAWFGAYDHVALAQLFGTMMDFPGHIPMWTNELKQEHRRFGYPRLREQVGGVHDALEDARHLVKVAKSLNVL